jgi:hypothetical protein
MVGDNDILDLPLASEATRNEEADYLNVGVAVLSQQRNPLRGIVSEQRGVLWPIPMCSGKCLSFKFANLREVDDGGAANVHHNQGFGSEKSSASERRM